MSHSLNIIWSCMGLYKEGIAHHFMQLYFVTFLSILIKM